MKKKSNFEKVRDLFMDVLREEDAKFDRVLIIKDPNLKQLFEKKQALKNELEKKNLLFKELADVICKLNKCHIHKFYEGQDFLHMGFNQMGEPILAKMIYKTCIICGFSTDPHITEKIPYQDEDFALIKQIAESNPSQIQEIATQILNLREELPALRKQIEKSEKHFSKAKESFRENCNHHFKVIDKFFKIKRCTKCGLIIKE